jgi:hypothetical protein
MQINESRLDQAWQDYCTAVAEHAESQIADLEHEKYPYQAAYDALRGLPADLRDETVIQNAIGRLIVILGEFGGKLTAAKIRAGILPQIGDAELGSALGPGIENSGVRYTGD